MLKDNFDKALCAPFMLDGFGANERHGVMIIHGFAGSPAQMLPLGQALNKLGYTVSGIRLPGHCTTLKEMSHVTWKDYLTAARAGYNQLKARCDDVVPVGLSMGGSLALIVCAEHPEAPACVTLSAAIKPANKLAPLSPVLKYVLPPVTRWPASWIKRGENFLDRYDYGYCGMPLRRVDDLMRLSRMSQSRLKDVRCPTLVMQSKGDKLVNPVSADIIMRGLGSEHKKLVLLDHPSHIITLGPDREIVIREVGELLARVSAPAVSC